MGFEPTTCELDVPSLYRFGRPREDLTEDRRKIEEEDRRSTEDLSGKSRIQVPSFL